MTKTSKYVLIALGGLFGFMLFPPMSAAHADPLTLDTASVADVVTAAMGKDYWVALGLGLSLALSGVEKYGSKTWPWLSTLQAHTAISAIAATSFAFSQAFVTEASGGAAIGVGAALWLAVKLTGTALLTDWFQYKKTPEAK